MSRKVIVVLCLVVMVLGAGLWVVGAQEEEGHPIVTTASSVVGVGTYVAAQPLAVAGSEEAPAPITHILPYSIYPDMMVMSIEEFVQPAPLVEGFTFTWSLEGGTLVGEGPVAIFLAETEGQYTLTLNVTDEAGNAAEPVSWVVYATTYLGNGYFSAAPADNQCITCHEERVAEWAETGHASMLTRGLDGELSSHYNEACIVCHTTGYTMGDNGGFDDAAAAEGWTFPEELVAGNWDALVADFPATANMANIQCESCHGPGALHPPAGGDDDEGDSGPGQPGPINRGLSFGICAQCHAEGPYHVFPQQLENSAHGQLAARGWTFPIGEEERGCVRCHSGEGFIDHVKGIPEDESRVDYAPVACAVCHDPHNATNPNQLRVYDATVLPEGEVSGFGAGVTCMACHNVRRDGGAVGQVEGFATAGSISMPHQGNNQSSLIAMTGGYTWGEALPNSPHGQVVENACVGCHMGATPGNDADGNPLPGQNEVGAHSFAMVNADGVENVGVCQQCHVGATSFEFEAARDYDGDGAYESVQAEIAGLREALLAALVNAGIPDPELERGFTLPENPSVELLGAFWNFHFTAREGTAVHNFRYAVSLLQLSIEKLTGESVGDPLPAR